MKLFGCGVIQGKEACEEKLVDYFVWLSVLLWCVNVEVAAKTFFYFIL